MPLTAKLVLPFILALGWAGIAVANPALEPIFENTVRITSSDGRVDIYFNRDGTFTSRGPQGDKFGTWRVDGEKVCTKIRNAKESCGVIEPGRTVGDEWEHIVAGETITVAIIAGR